MNAPERQALTVTELNTLAKEYLENLPLFRSVSVKGELSNVTLHRTGHIYFSIKDEGAAVSAVMWRSDAASLGFTPENGQKVTAEVPLSEVFKYATDLRAMTQARGSFKMEFVRYEDVPANIAQKIIEQAKKDEEDDE